jgi:hypothetical protein
VGGSFLCYRRLPLGGFTEDGQEGYLEAQRTEVFNSYTGWSSGEKKRKVELA